MTTRDDQTAIAERHERDVQTPHGRVYTIEIPGDDPPFVLMHGFPDDHRIYDKLLPHLSPRRAVAFDFVGYGRSERTDGAHFSPEDHGAEITAVLDALDIDRAILVGHDASGPDAVVFSITNPRRVADLVLLNTIFGNRPSLVMPEMTRLFGEPQLQTLADDMVRDPNQLLWLLQRWGVQWELDANDPDGVVRHSILPQFYGDDDQPDAVASVRAWCAGLRDTLDRQDALVNSGALSQIEVPVSIIWGENDQYLSPSHAAEIAALFPEASAHFLPGAGHWPQHDQPHQVAELLKSCPTT